MLRWRATEISGATGAQNQDESKQLTPTIHRARESFIKSRRLRNDHRFIQACAFAMNFSHAEAQKAIQWANDCRLSWLKGGSEEAWLALQDANRLDFIQDLLEDVIRGAAGQINSGRPLTMGVSSGYDSRTILCFLRRIGIIPDTYTFGQIGNLDFDYVSLLSRQESLETRIFDTSELEWNLEALDSHACHSQDFPVSPRVPADATLDAAAPCRLEIHGHLGDSLTGIQQNLDDTWEMALRLFCNLSNRFKLQFLFTPDELADFLPARPFVDSTSLAYSRQLDIGYLEHQSMRPLGSPSADYILPFEDPKWVGFWLNRSPAETAGQSLWLRFLQSLGASEFAEFRGTRIRTRSAARTRMAEFLYGTENTKGKIDLSSADKVLVSSGGLHFCLFACHSNNAHFRKMVDRSIERLRRRGIFQHAFIDGVTRNFAARVPNSDSMLNGLISIDVMAEAQRFD
jgi:hypothetical protein